MIAWDRRWQSHIDTGRFANIKSLTQRLGREPGRVASVLRLAMLAPEVIERLIKGKNPNNFSTERLRGKLPEKWSE